MNGSKDSQGEKNAVEMPCANKNGQIPFRHKLLNKDVLCRFTATAAILFSSK